MRKGSRRETQLRVLSCVVCKINWHDASTSGRQRARGVPNENSSALGRACLPERGRISIVDECGRDFQQQSRCARASSALCQLCTAATHVLRVRSRASPRCSGACGLWAVVGGRRRAAVVCASARRRRRPARPHRAGPRRPSLRSACSARVGESGGPGVLCKLCSSVMCVCVMCYVLFIFIIIFSFFC